MDTKKVISTLNTLLETTEDGVREFVACAEGVSSPHLKMVFETAARRCEEGGQELKTTIRGLGGSPQRLARSAVHSIGPGPTSFQRSPGWMNIRSWRNASAERTLQRAPMSRRWIKTFPRPSKPSSGGSITA